jgi:hypothetical protein
LVFDSCKNKGRFRKWKQILPTGHTGSRHARQTPAGQPPCRSALTLGQRSETGKKRFFGVISTLLAVKKTILQGHLSV